VISDRKYPRFELKGDIHMIISSYIAYRLGYHGLAEVDGVFYYCDAFRAKYSFDGTAVYFKALPLGADIPVKEVGHLLLEDKWYIGYPKKERPFKGIPDEENTFIYEWDRIYDANKPFLYKNEMIL